MPQLQIDLVGADGVRRSLEEIRRIALKAVAGALYQEAELIMSESVKITPVDTGALRGTAHVKLPEFTGENVRINFGFGGPAAPYAVDVHENPIYRHKAPTTYKFLEGPALLAVRGLSQRVVRRIGRMR